MDTLYEKNGLVFWTQEEIQIRKMLEEYFVSQITDGLKTQNSAFDMVQVEAPLLTPREKINQNYTDEDIFTTHDDLVLRPETTTGSFQAAEALLNKHNKRKHRFPLVVWQHGKSFRYEQDQPTKFMRLKEFYQLEFQIIYGLTTQNDYSVKLIPVVEKMISQMIGPCRVEPSDRIPNYAEWTQDIICEKSDMEVCSISKRTDYSDANVLEVAIGTDRCVYNFLEKK